MTKQKTIVKDEMKQPKEWEVLESPNFFKFSAIGDTLEGLLMSRDVSSRYGFGLYTLKTFKGEQKRFHGSSQLDDLLLNVEIPAYVRIKFVDIQETPAGEMKLFEVSEGKN